jgi:YggT family protein
MAGLLYLIYYLVLIYSWLIVIRALLSWFPPKSGSTVHPLRKVLFRVTEPYLRFFRRFIPVIRIGSSGFDASAIVALLVLFFFIQVLVRA